MNFEEYLQSKNIDSESFKKTESLLWENWKHEFEQIHPNSFTVQKLNLINPIRRKFALKNIEKVDTKPVEASSQPAQVVKNLQAVAAPKTDDQTTAPASIPSNPVTPKPVVPRPVFKPKPKID